MELGNSFVYEASKTCIKIKPCSHIDFISNKNVCVLWVLGSDGLLIKQLFSFKINKRTGGANYSILLSDLNFTLLNYKTHSIVFFFIISDNKYESDAMMTQQNYLDFISKKVEKSKLY